MDAVEARSICAGITIVLLFLKRYPATYYYGWASFPVSQGLDDK